MVEGNGPGPVTARVLDNVTRGASVFVLFSKDRFRC